MDVEKRTVGRHRNNEPAEESRPTVQTPKSRIAVGDQARQPAPRASALTRILAGLCDLCLSMATATACSIGVSRLVSTSKPSSGALIMTIASLVFLMCVVLYHAVFDCSPMRGTPGKRILGLRVTDPGGRRIGFVTSFTRTLVKFAGLIPLGAGTLWMLVDDKRRTLQDRMSGTMVLEKPGFRSVLYPSDETLRGILHSILLLVLLGGGGFLAAQIIVPEYRKAHDETTIQMGLSNAAHATRYVEESIRSGKGVPLEIPAEVMSASAVQGVAMRYLPRSANIEISYTLKTMKAYPRIVLKPSRQPDGSIQWSCVAISIPKDYLPRECASAGRGLIR
jgi:uncharacterized RDD family membrane protein YckC